MAGQRDLGRHHGAWHARGPCRRSAERLGFRVSGWSRSAKAIAGIECFHGEAQFDAFLRQTDILVCLLPLTADTRHILNRDVFAKLNRNSPLGAPVLINAGRGGLQNEADILDCLDDGTLGAASLDVFATEPLPADSPFWTHPKVVLTPHNAADTDPDEISKYVAQQIERFEAGGALENVVDEAGVLAFPLPVEKVIQRSPAVLSVATLTRHDASASGHPLPRGEGESRRPHPFAGSVCAKLQEWPNGSMMRA